MRFATKNRNLTTTFYASEIWCNDDDDLRVFIMECTKRKYYLHLPGCSRLLYQTAELPTGFASCIMSCREMSMAATIHALSACFGDLNPNRTVQMQFQFACVLLPWGFHVVSRRHCRLNHHHDNTQQHAPSLPPSAKWQSTRCKWGEGE